MNELLLMWTGYIVYICLGILFIVSSIAYSWHLILNHILINKESRKIFYVYLAHKKRIIEIIEKEKLK